MSKETQTKEAPGTAPLSEQEYPAAKYALAVYSTPENKQRQADFWPDMDLLADFTVADKRMQLANAAGDDDAWIDAWDIWIDAYPAYWWRAAL